MSLGGSLRCEFNNCFRKQQLESGTPGRSEDTKQLHLLYLDQQLLLLNIWPMVSLLSRPQVKKAHAVIAAVVKVWSGFAGWVTRRSKSKIQTK